ncbi:hypothetical protein [Clostridium butyricum]
MEDEILQIEKSINSLNSIGGFLSSGNEYKANTMSITWGSVGYMWTQFRKRCEQRRTYWN